MARNENSLWTPAFSRRSVLAGGLAGAAAAALPSVAWSQAKKKDEGPPEPEEISLETKDYVHLKATYYGGTAGKNTVPILMVHGWEGQRDEYRQIALALQQQKHAVLTVDLRGHGQSTRQEHGDDVKDLEPDNLGRADMELMVRDLEACKRFLVEKNNAGDLNVAALCVVAAEYGAIVAIKWAHLDWMAKRLPAYKQGQDVRGLVLLSPLESFKGVTCRPLLARSPISGKNVSKMIYAGAEDAKALQEAKAMNKTFERTHGGKAPAPEEAAAEDTLFFFTEETKLQGTQLLDGRAFSTGRNLLTFINWRLVGRMDDFPWEERKNPLGD